LGADYLRNCYTIERVGESHAAAKVLIERGSGKIVGAHLLAPEASELINIFGLAMRAGLGAAHLKRLVSAYPRRVRHRPPHLAA
jgi:glutathione reductase (NADPH)